MRLWRQIIQILRAEQHFLACVFKKLQKIWSNWGLYSDLGELRKSNRCRPKKGELRKPRPKKTLDPPPSRKSTPDYRAIIGKRGGNSLQGRFEQDSKN